MARDMPTAAERSKTEAARHPFGPRPIGALLPAVTRTAFRVGFRSIAGLIAEWPSIVGTRLAETATPRRLAAGTLTLSCIGPVALELQHSAQPLMERINRHLGSALVQRLKFVQGVRLATPNERAQASVPARSPPVPVHGIPDGPLRDALGSLGGLIPRDHA